jgi:hypothetical protein
MSEYGMYSPRGNDLVDGVVRVARREGWDWGKTQRHLQLLAKAHPTAAREAMDTAVREEVWAALNRG